MVKNILKVLYVAFGVILAFVVYIVGYNSNGYSHIESLTSKAIEAKDYTEVAMIHGGCFEKNSLITEDSDVLDMAIFPSTTLSSVQYYVSEDTTEVKNSYDNSYYIYIFNPNFETTNLKAATTTNGTGIRFKSASGSYDYKFVLTDTVNASEMVEKPGSIKESILKGERDLFQNYTNWSFYNFTLTQSIVEAMSDSLNGEINSISVLNSSSEEVFSIDVQLDFSQQFFEDVKPLVENYNTYIEEVNSDNEEIKNAANDKFDKFYLGDENTKGFEETFKENVNYTFRHPDSYLQPTKLVWQTIGMLAIYLVCFALLYVLLFHFAFLKRLISRESHNSYRKNPGVKQRQNKEKGSTGKNSEDIIDVKPSEPAEEVHE